MNIIMLRFSSVMLALAVMIMAGCNSRKENSVPKSVIAGIKSVRYGRLPNKVDPMLYRLVNAKGAELRVTDYGAKVVGLKLPDRTGKLSRVLLGFDTFNQYLKSKSRFSCVGVFDDDVWRTRPFRSKDGPSVQFTHIYDNDSQISLTYTLTDENKLRIECSGALCVMPELFFNLTGSFSHDILGSELNIYASSFMAIDSSGKKTDVIHPVEGTPFDFITEPQSIGTRIIAKDKQLEFGQGYDHTWIINNSDNKELKLAARVYDALSGRFLDVHTTLPGIHFDSGNFLDGTMQRKGGGFYQERSGFSLTPEFLKKSKKKPVKAETVYQFYAE